jgi:hypothetical protein
MLRTLSLSCRVEVDYVVQNDPTHVGFVRHVT